MSRNTMQVEIMTPEKKVVSKSAEKIVAEAHNGSFCLKPRHIDFVAELVPSILMYWVMEEEFLLAIDGGILAKQGDQVNISVRHAVKGNELEELEIVVNKQFKKLDQKERETQTALEHLQADFIKRFVELKKRR
jgi:F-type H+-transporting ATPase subunit epsilon